MNNKQHQYYLLKNQQYSTPNWSSIYSSHSHPLPNSQHFSNQNQSNPKKSSVNSILDKIKSVKHLDVHNIDISNKKTLKKILHQNVISPSYPSISQPFNTFSQNILTLNSKSSKKPFQNINLSSKKPSKQKYQQPTASWTYKITPQKPVRSPLKQNYNLTPSRPKNSKQPHSSNRNLSIISIHQQLYLESKKKQNRYLAQKVLQNQYFQKKHPFHPSISQRSHLLAQNKFLRQQQKQNFIKQFMIEDQSTSIVPKLDNHQEFLLREQMKNVKNQNFLNRLFYFLSQQEEILSKQHLEKKNGPFYQLPLPCLKYIEEILENIFKMSKTSQNGINFPEFLSEFNLKCKNKTSFFLLIQNFFNKLDIQLTKRQMEFKYHFGFNKQDNNDQKSTLPQQSIQMNSKQINRFPIENTKRI